VRTTLSLDDDVANLLNKEVRRSGISLKKAVNDLLRVGLMASSQQTHKPFVVTPRALGLPPGLSYNNVEELLEALEGSGHK
jgi:hypothetical protein